MDTAESGNRHLTWIYWGTLITSLGSFTFPGATIGVMTQLNYPLWQIGALMAIARFGVIFGSFLLGDLSEKIDSKKVVLWTELFGFIFTALLIFVWKLGSAYYWLFAVLVFLRFFAVSIGGPGRNRMIKVLKDKYNQDHFDSGVVLNVVTHGPGVIGSLIGFAAIKYYSYEWVLVFDGLTFIINGLILLKLVDVQPIQTNTQDKTNLITKMSIYFSFRKLSYLDILLALPFMGTNVLMSRLSGGIGYRVPLLLTTFGLAVFISSTLLKISKSNRTHLLAYGALLLSFVFLIFTHSIFYLVVVGVFLRNLSYWYLYNLYTGTYQQKGTVNNISSLFAARTVIGTSIIAIGDILFGSVAGELSLVNDLLIRATLTVIALIFAIKFKAFKSE